MEQNRRLRAISDVMMRYRRGQLSRRAAIQLLAGLGLTTAGALVVVGRGGAPAKAVGGSSHAGHFAALAQAGGTPEAPLQEEGAPPAPATPELGEQPDGTFVWRVVAGGVSEEELIDAMAFFPEEITINAGDTIYFEIHGLHTVTFLSGEEAPPFIVPETALGTPVAGGTPAAGGPRLVLNPAAAFPAGGNTYDGTGFVNSGVPDPSAPPFTLTFAQPGTYEYLCLVHPEPMKARVVVQEQGAERPHDQAYYDQQATEQLEQILGQGRTLIERHSQATPAAGAEGTAWEVAAGVGEGQAEVLRFLPDRLEVKAGDTVRWTNRALSDPHTVTFTGGEAPPELLLVEPQAGGPPLFVLNPEAVQPTGGPTYTGQGLANSGLLVPGQEAGLPTTYELTFDAPGEYPYLCLLHAGPAEGGEGTPPAGDAAVEFVGMTGTIVVS